MIQLKDLREKEKKELLKLLGKSRAELSDLRTKRASNSLPDGSLIEKKRREIARILSVLEEKEILASSRGSEEVEKKVVKDAEKKTQRKN